MPDLACVFLILLIISHQLLQQSRVNFLLCFLDVVSGSEYKASTLHKFENANSAVISAE